MRGIILPVLILGLVLACTATANDELIKSAQSAAPPSISDKATIMDWDNNVLREGANGWTCLPDRKDTPGNDPWCVNKPWLNFLDALMNKKNPTYSQVGIAYMLMGDTPVSNSDPYASEPKPGDDWVEGLGPHLMILVPDPKMLENVPTHSKNGGPWIMWRDTPYAHLMVPLENYPN
ncbi:hypothetical protein MYX04_10755 [Nitrospiraceae bacterium AH_259_D15_M11_P09]|nr:hypothetical protein [Nitrospiraceae bacterium AH_259_D15_M11_P09]